MFVFCVCMVFLLGGRGGGAIRVKGGRFCSKANLAESFYPDPLTNPKKNTGIIWY